MSKRSLGGGFAYRNEKHILLDELNVRILEELTADPRLRTTELARRLGVSTPTVRERVTRLEESGVIRGYRLDIDPAALGLPVAAWVRLRPGPGQMPRITEMAARVRRKSSSATASPARTAS